MDKLLHDVRHALGTGGHEVLKLLVALQLVGVGSAHAVVRLYDHGIANPGNKVPAALDILHQMVAGHGNSGLLVVFLHAGFVLDAVQIAHLKTAGDVEVGAELCVLLQPVFVVGLQPVDAAILEGQEGHGPVYFVVVFQTAHLVILGQAVFQLRPQLVVGLVADAQHVQTVVFQLTAELPVVGGKIGGNEDDVFHGCFLSSLCIRFIQAAWGGSILPAYTTRANRGHSRNPRRPPRC